MPPTQLTYTQSELKFSRSILQPKGLITEVLSEATKAALVVTLNAWCANVANKYKAIVNIDFENDAEGAHVYLSYYDFTPIEPPVTRSIENTSLSSPPLG